MRRLIIPILFIFALCLSSNLQAQKSSKMKPNITEEVVKAGKINLTTPIQIKCVEIYRDGGTIAAIIEDATGKELTFALYSILSGVPRKVHVGVKNPCDELEAGQDTYILPVGGEEERALLKVLKEWKMRSVSENKRIMLDNILKLDSNEQRLAFDKLSKEDKSIIHVFDVIKILECR